MAKSGKPPDPDLNSNNMIIDDDQQSSGDLQTLTFPPNIQNNQVNGSANYNFTILRFLHHHQNA